MDVLEPTFVMEYDLKLYVKSRLLIHLGSLIVLEIEMDAQP